MNRITYDGEFQGELRRSLIAALNSEIYGDVYPPQLRPSGDL